jgi:integrase
MSGNVEVSYSSARAAMQTLTQDNPSHIGTLSEVRSRQDIGEGSCLDNHGPKRRLRSAFSKSDLRYWEDNVFLPKNGKGATSHLYVVRLGSRYQRTTFPLQTANKKEAARKAKAIQEHLLANGWEATLDAFKERERRPETLTVAQYLSEVKKLATVKPATLTANVRCFHQILSGAFRIEPPREGSKYQPTLAGERGAWLAKLDGIRLDQITPERITHWLNRFIAEAGNDQLAIRTAKLSARSIMQQAGSLFNRRLLDLIQPAGLPENPFATVHKPRRPSQRYRSDIDFGKLIRAANKELTKADVEAFKAFVLMSFAGLRRSEADALRWDALEAKGGFLRLKSTSDFAGKSEESLSDVYLDKEVVRLLEHYRSQSDGLYVLQSDGVSRPGATYAHYRAEETFTRLASWLRGHGVSSPKPLHLLRKEYGSVLARTHGILVASHGLRHSSISLTREHYVDPRSSAVTGLGHLLKSPQGSAKQVGAKPGKTPSTRAPKKRLTNR